MCWFSLEFETPDLGLLMSTSLVYILVAFVTMPACWEGWTVTHSI